MKEILIDGVNVEFSSVVSVWNCYGKCIGPLRPFKATVGFEEVIHAFDNFYSDFLENESEDDDPNFLGYEELGVIRTLNYPSLRVMLEKYPDVFCLLSKKHFLVDLLGFIFYAQESEFKEKAYVLNDVTNIDISNLCLHIDGHVATKEN